MLRMLDSDYIVGFYGCYESKEDFIILLELVEGGNLFDLLRKERRFEEVRAAHCVFDVLKGLEYLKGKGVIHRDIKLKNIIFKQTKDNYKYKLCDFGLSDLKENIIDKSPETGTPGYIAPEIFLFKIHINGDIFSVGIILFYLLMGYIPYNKKSKYLSSLLMKNKEATIIFKECWS